MNGFSAAKRVPRISVALCTYNGAAYLEEQLRSILEQTHPVDELLVFDDHSTDGTLAILERWQSSYPHVLKVHYNGTNLGARKNFEAALQACSGDVIFLSDQDDRWYPDKVRLFLDAFEAAPGVLALFSNGDLMDEAGQLQTGTIWERQGYDPADPAAGDLHQFLIYHWNVVTGSALALRREALPHILPFRLTNHFWHDEWIGFRLSALGVLRALPRATYAYRLHPGQATGMEVRTAIPNRPRAGLWRRTPRQTELLQRFVAEWLAYDKIRLLHREGAFTGNPAAAADRFRSHKQAYLAALPWASRKLHLLKWYLNGEFQTGLREVIGR